MKHWKFERFKGDGAIYGICPNCNFYHNVSTLDENLVPHITNQFLFCPACGDYLYDPNPETSPIIKYERNILDLYNEECNEEYILNVVKKRIKENDR